MADFQAFVVYQKPGLTIRSSRRSHLVEHISYNDLNVRAETAMTNRLYHMFHDARRERDPRLEVKSR